MALLNVYRSPEQTRREFQHFSPGRAIIRFINPASSPYCLVDNSFVLSVINEIISPCFNSYPKNVFQIV